MEGKIGKMERTNLMHSFLQKNHLDEKPFKWITGDASFRRYARIGEGNDTVILMDSPPSDVPPFGKTEEFVIIDKILVNAGLSAPKIYDVDLDNGFMILEDLGDDSYAEMLAKGADEYSLYKAAVDALIEIAKIKDVQNVAPYDTEVIHYGAGLFTDWFMPAVLGKGTDESVRQEYFDIIDALFDSIKQAPSGLMLADYHIRNLMYLHDREGFKSCGLLDFQDGTVGPIAYDLMSLLEDARRDVPSQLQKELLQYYLDKMHFENNDLFMKSYHITAIKRHLRVIGIFARLKIRDGKNEYWEHIPRVWRLLETHLDLPYTQDLKNWLDRNVPDKYRGIR